MRLFVAFVFLFCTLLTARAQQDSLSRSVSGTGQRDSFFVYASNDSEELHQVVYTPLPNNSIFAPKQNRFVAARQHRDSIRATRNVWWIVLGGPSYTPEASAGLGAAALISFRINKKDSLSYRSFVPFGFSASLNKTFTLAGTAQLFMNENKVRMNIKYSYRNEPVHYFGKGFDVIENTSKGKSTTLFHREEIQVQPKLMLQFRPHWFAVLMSDVHYVSTSDFAEKMRQDPYFLKFSHSYYCIGNGVGLQFDSRNDISTATSGMLLSAMAQTYGKYIGGTYNYTIFELEYKHFVNVFRPRSTLAWTAKTQMSIGDIPFTELPTFGSANDLRGFYGGKYRDRSMAYALAEYRHMFGSAEAYNQGKFYSRLGFVAWVGTGTLGSDISRWTKWKINYGVGIRLQIQPNKNVRFDYGRGIGDGGCFYMGMTEAF